MESRNLILKSEKLTIFLMEYSFLQVKLSVKLQKFQVRWMLIEHELY